MAKKKNQKTKAVKHTVYIYYLTSEKVTVRELSEVLTESDAKLADRIEIWPDMGSMEISFPNDSFIWEEAMEEFSDSEDQEYINRCGISSIYALSYDQADEKDVSKLLDLIRERFCGRLCRDDEALQ